MEVMEDGNLMDKVNILIQRDMEYYDTNQSILQETICAGVIGGKLDFPRSASFASMKLVIWWEEEFVAAYKKSSEFLPKIKKADKQADDDSEGIVKDSDPSKFVSLIAKSADQLLAHLHILTQEALDHADLTVLTGTIGASALLKNCLWFYIKIIKEDKKCNIEEIQSSYKKYHEMCEALAERLLDLHCRLVSLYILQDAECLDWESEKPFFESERGSYIIQMWWLYMQGTKDDLWNTVPPKMAQRVFAGMLNESLTILTVRYTQSVPSEIRSQLIVVDISNLLVCVANLLPAICNNAKDLVGVSYSSSSKILRDIHTKCQELYTCLLLRGAPIDLLHKVFRRGIDVVEMFKSRSAGDAPWITFALPNMFDDKLKPGSKTNNNPDTDIALELVVMLAQPQPNWALLLKILCMNKYRILQLALKATSSQFKEKMEKPVCKNTKCTAFLCNEEGSCKDDNTSSTYLQQIHYYNIILSSTEILLFVGNKQELTDILLPIIILQPDWCHSLERRHVWNQIRPPWYEAILNFSSPIIPLATDTVINAIQTGATMYQAMSLILACFSHFWDCVNPALYRVSCILQESILTDIVPLNNSTLVQILVSALYSHLLKKSQEVKKEVRIDENTEPTSSRQLSVVSVGTDNVNSSPEAIALATAECLCSIDEDNKHTNQIEEFLEHIKLNSKFAEGEGNISSRLEANQHFAEVVVSEILGTSSGRNSLKTIYWFIKCNSDYFYKQLGVSTEPEEIEPKRALVKPISLLHTMFNIGSQSFDQLLSGNWHPNWLSLLQNARGLSADRVWKQLSLRWEFRNVNATAIPPHISQMIGNITAIFKQ
ncbi:uncharacterized protein KIAA0825 homolog [Diabrotica virgifera virgifera]|uniref:Uncharacterized protein n=1 Tax=Diabrotica virgifera virgifera TaxID=50390 RepID=A0ABM5KX91_DIAVI|nr:uncharacterized protein KIAA0825 homolog [Diabrotica virgifera virgifera]